MVVLCAAITPFAPISLGTNVDVIGLKPDISVDGCRLAPGITHA